MAKFDLGQHGTIEPMRDYWRRQNAAKSKATRDLVRQIRNHTGGAVFLDVPMGDKTLSVGVAKSEIILAIRAADCGEQLRFTVTAGNVHAHISFRD